MLPYYIRYYLNSMECLYIKSETLKPVANAVSINHCGLLLRTPSGIYVRNLTTHPYSIVNLNISEEVKFDYIKRLENNKFKESYITPTQQISTQIKTSIMPLKYYNYRILLLKQGIDLLLNPFPQEVYVRKGDKNELKFVIINTDKNAIKCFESYNDYFCDTTVAKTFSIDLNNREQIIFARKTLMN